MQWRSGRRSSAGTVTLVCCVVLALCATIGCAGASAVAPCRQSQLAGHLVDGPNTATTFSVVIALRNTSGRGCAVTGHPTVTFVGQAGRKLPDAGRSTGPARVTAVPPGGYAHATLEYRGPGPAGPRNCATVAEVRISIRELGATYELTTRPLAERLELCDSVDVVVTSLAAGEGPIHHLGA
jgi:Protein of unknown function (DUF4232)